MQPVDIFFPVCLSIAKYWHLEEFRFNKLLVCAVVKLIAPRHSDSVLVNKLLVTCSTNAHEFSECVKSLTGQTTNVWDRKYESLIDKLWINAEKAWQLLACSKQELKCILPLCVIAYCSIKRNNVCKF